MFRRLLLTCGWAALMLGLVLQLWLKDRFMVLTLAFYALPKPCLAVLAFLLMGLSRTRLLRSAAALAFGLLLTWWAVSSWNRAMPTKLGTGGSGEEVTLLFWNLCRPHDVDAQAVRLMEELKPDIGAFVEPGNRAGELLGTYEERLPGYKAAWMPRGILWLCRFPSRYRDRGKLDESGAYARFDVNLPGGTFPVVVADVFPGIFRPRSHQLHETLQHTLGRTDVVVVGDFNTPLESVFFEAYRSRFTNALEAAGDGFKETWPCGLPLLSLDQAWTGGDWQVLEARKIWRLTGSDHAALYIRLRRRQP